MVVGGPGRGECSSCGAANGGRAALLLSSSCSPPSSFLRMAAFGPGRRTHTTAKKTRSSPRAWLGPAGRGGNDDHVPLPPPPSLSRRRPVAFVRRALARRRAAGSGAPACCDSRSRQRCCCQTAAAKKHHFAPFSQSRLAQLHGSRGPRGRGGRCHHAGEAAA